MAVQNSANLSTVPFVRSGESLVKEGQTLLTDGGRATPLLSKTVVAKVAASQKWVPLTSLTAVDGGAVAQGIYLGDDIAAADIAAGDIADFGPVLVGGACTVDENQVVMDDGTVDIDDVFSGNAAGSGTATPYFVVTVRDLLAMRGIYLEATVDIDEYENA